MRRLLCLCMIVRNESHCVKTCIEKYLPSIDAYAIVDTGSTDGTPELIENIFKEKGIHGKVIRSNWVNFSINRNESIKVSQEVIRSYYGLPENGPLSLEECNKHIDDVWYAAISDADNTILKGVNMEINRHNYNEILEKENPPLIKECMSETDGGDTLDLIKDEYQMTLVDSGSVYTNTQFIRLRLHGAKGWKYECPVHEYIHTVGWNSQSSHLKDCCMYSGRHGGRSKSNAKYVRDAFMLESDLLDCYVDHEDVLRCTFYKAQSYRDCGKREESFKDYEKRAKDTGGYDQERYISYLRMGDDLRWSYMVNGKLLSDIQIRLMEIEYYLLAHEVSPHRREAINKLCDYFTERNMFKTGWKIFGKDVVDNPNIKPFDLVPNINDYGFMFYEKIAIFAYKAGDHENYKILVERCLQDPKIKLDENKDHYDRILSHRKWYNSELKFRKDSVNNESGNRNLNGPQDMTKNYRDGVDGVAQLPVNIAGKSHKEILEMVNSIIRK